MLYDCLWRTVLRGIVLRHTVLAKFLGTIAGGASGLSRIGTMADGQPDGFYVIQPDLILGSIELEFELLLHVHHNRIVLTEGVCLFMTW